jgi:Cdc6-like AAA superfamily ATPase
MGADVVGRDAELRTTARFLDSLAGQPQALLLEGEPGIGKTTLWLAAVEQARQHGFRVLLCRPSAAEAQLSYASLADLLADVGDPVLESLPQPQRRAIDFVLLRADAEPAVADYRATGAALLSVVERLADEKPVLLAQVPGWSSSRSGGWPRGLGCLVRCGARRAATEGRRSRSPTRPVSAGCGWGR